MRKMKMCEGGCQIVFIFLWEKAKLCVYLDVQCTASFNLLCST